MNLAVNVYDSDFFSGTHLILLKLRPTLHEVTESLEKEKNVVFFLFG